MRWGLDLSLVEWKLTTGLVHFFSWHFCFWTPGPPNFGLSLFWERNNRDDGALKHFKEISLAGPTSSAVWPEAGAALQAAAKSVLEVALLHILLGFKLLLCDSVCKADHLRTWDQVYKFRFLLGWFQSLHRQLCQVLFHYIWLQLFHLDLSLLGIPDCSFHFQSHCMSRGPCERGNKSVGQFFNQGSESTYWQSTCDDGWLKKKLRIFLRGCH